jgi:NitT/TauT family transport system substrate-binding protein
LADLKGKQISVPFGSAAHGMLLRALRDLGWDPEKDVSLVAQSPEVGGSALKAHKIDAHADFVPFAELFPYRGYARKIYDGSSVKTPTSHGVVARGAFADQYPELVVAFLKAVIEADRWMAANPEAAAELVQKVAGVDAPVVYMFHGPEGVQTRELAIRPEVRKSLAVAYETLTLLKRVDTPLDLDKWIDDRFVRQAAKESGYEYEAHLKGPALVSKPSVDRVAEIWLQGEDHVRGFRSVAEAFRALGTWEAEGKKTRVVFVKDGETNIKLLADKVSYATVGGDVKAFLTRAAAARWAGSHKGQVASYGEVRASLTKQAEAKAGAKTTASAEPATDRRAAASP